MSARPVAVVVLAGGEGRRMGGGKALRAYGGTTLVGHAVGLALTWSPVVAVAVRSADQIAGVDAPLILDDPDTEGPAAGLAAAFAFAGREGATLLLTLPCDTPNLPADLLARLEAGLGEAAVAMAASGGRLQPVCALWRRDAGAGLAGYLAAGRRSLKGFAAACGMAIVDWDTADGDPFAGANTPDELAALQPQSE